jgi:hypothetical protein
MACQAQRDKSYITLHSVCNVGQSFVADALTSPNVCPKQSDFQPNVIQDVKKYNRETFLKHKFQHGHAKLHSHFAGNVGHLSSLLPLLVPQDHLKQPSSKPALLKT